MNEILRNILLVLGAIFLAPMIGALISGLDRKVTARMQGRKGPPIIQPFYDVIKLLRKDPITLNKVQILYAYLHLAFMVLVLVLLALGQDMLLALFCHAFSTVALILGGMCVRSPFSRIGSQRKIIAMLAYEPILVLLVVGIYFTSGHTGQLPSFMAWEVLARAGSTGPLLLSMPLIFAAFLMAVAIKLEKSPFDVASSHHAHQELVKGITLEYSGPYLAILEISHFYEMALLFGVIVFFWATMPLVGVALAVVSFFGMAMLDNLCARLTAMWMLRTMWTVALGLAMANIIWLNAK